MRRLQGLRYDTEISRAKILSLEGKGLVRPSLDDEIKRFLEPLSALFQGYAVAGILVRDTPATPNSKRPLLRMSAVAASSAIFIGLCKGSKVTAVPTRMRVVRCAAAASTISGSAKIENSRLK